MALYLKLDVWNGSVTKTLGAVQIVRDITDHPFSNIGNYHVEFHDERTGEMQQVGPIKQYDRSKGAWELARIALEMCEGLGDGKAGT